MSDDKRDRLKITNPRLLARQAETVKSIQASIDRINANREDGGITMDERIAMAREMAGDRAQDVEIGDDGSVTVTLAPRH